MTRRQKNKIKAISYVVGGLAIALLAGGFIVFMYFSGDFLPGIDWTSFNWWIRKALYVVSVIAFFAAFALAGYGWNYLEERR